MTWSDPAAPDLTAPDLTAPGPTARLFPETSKNPCASGARVLFVLHDELSPGRRVRGQGDACALRVRCKVAQRAP
jgi:hypothetical protein